MKVFEHKVERLIRQRVEIDEIRCDFMSGIDKWLVHLVQSMYKDVGSRVRVDDGYSEEIGV